MPRIHEKEPWARSQTMQINDKVPETEQGARNRVGHRPQGETMPDVRTTVSERVGWRASLSQVQINGSLAQRLTPVDDNGRVPARMLQRRLQG